MAMDLDARPYRSFVKVAELQSFRRAAVELNVTQPALSAQIRELERLLGFDLFVRTNRIVRLTPEGSIFLDKARRYIVENDWVNQAAKDIRNTKLRIGAAHFSALIPERNAVIENFLLLHPEMAISIKGRSPPQLLSDLANNDIDIAIAIEGDWERQEAVTAANVPLEKRILAERQVSLLMPTSFPDRLKDRIRANELTGIDVATFDRSHGVPISVKVAHRLTAAGARLIHPPEGDGPALMRYAKLRGMTAVDLGWFATPDGLERVHPSQMEMSTRLVILMRKAGRREAVEDFLSALPGKSESDGGAA